MSWGAWGPLATNKRPGVYTQALLAATISAYKTGLKDACDGGMLCLCQFGKSRFIDGVKKVKKEFLYIAELLNRQLNIVPLLFGSLGLEQRLHTNLNADDIDILIPEVFMNEKWNNIVTIMNNNGYCLYDLHEHAFEKSGISVAFASIEDLMPFAGINLTKIPVIEETGICYYLLNLQDYLKVYIASSKDGYRKNTKNKKDEEKIELINKAIRKTKLL